MLRVVDSSVPFCSDFRISLIFTSSKQYLFCITSFSIFNLSDVLVYFSYTVFSTTIVGGFFLFILPLVFFVMQSQEVSYSLNGRQKRNQIKFVSPSLTTKDLPVGFLHRQKLLVLVPSVQFCLIQKYILDCTDAGGYFQ